MNDIALLILKQNTALKFLWCRQCGLQYKKTLPVTMRPELLTCPGCDTEGMVVGNSPSKEP